MHRSPLLQAHEVAGARLAPRPEAPDATGVLTFGDVPAEYRAAQKDCALFDDTDRGALRVTGADAPAFLQRLLANDVRGLACGGGSRNLLLSGKGKVRHDFDLSLGAEGFLLQTPPGDAARLATDLDLYLFNEEVTLEDATAATAPFSLCGPNAAALLRRLADAPPPEADHAWLETRLGGMPVRISRLTVAGSPGYRVDGEPERAAELWETLRAAGARPAGFAARDILRVEACAALFGVDVTDHVYPQEARLEAGFSLDKGCYIGQEVVAKIDTYGGLNKRLFALSVSHDDPVPAGTRLLLDENGERRDLGLVTSWAYSFVLDTGLVLAYVKRRHQETGTSFELGDGGGEATIVDTPVCAGV